MTQLEKFRTKSGRGFNPDNYRSETIPVIDVFAAIEMAKDGVMPDGSCGDDMCSIWSAVTDALLKNRRS